MQVMGTNAWDFDADKDFLVARAIGFADMVKERGIAELLDAYIAADSKLMWCSWETDDLPGLQEAFDEMNRQSGLISAVTEVKEMYHAPVG